ncbi:hypothetical protein C2845_PM07G33090 [Panicum miliaceum]|uniref:Uncharacterized protein n=1 Tax=Panicum miliaceum TaxID=4540 RepID=A0A3L6SR28_PANMI|nr:hypothetical protein C2845_PM07G33090 [Panicum miliaceum]
MEIYLPSGCKDNRSIKAAQEVIERRYPYGMTCKDENAFIAAFVIYVMSTLFSPGSKHDYISVDYWNALVDLSCISSFDWCEYVIKRLFQGVVKVKSELNSSNKVTNITGCSIFLQVAGPLYYAVVEFESDCHRVARTGASLFTSVISFITEPFTMAVSLMLDVQKGKVEDGIVHISKKARTLSAEEPSGHNYSNRYQCDSKGDLGMKPNSDSIYNISLNCPAVVLKLCLAIWYMSRYYLVLRCMNKRLCCGPGPNVFRNPCDGNTPCFDFVDPSSEVCCVCKSRNRGCESCNAQRPVVLHFSSKHIEVSLDSFICQLEGGSELVMDMFDAIIRSLRQADDIMHSGKLCPRWRHFFESDFVVSILAGAFDPSDCNVLDHLVGSHIGYNVSSCKMIFVAEKDRCLALDAIKLVDNYGFIPRCLL